MLRLCRPTQFQSRTPIKPVLGHACLPASQCRHWALEPGRPSTRHMTYPIIALAPRKLTPAMIRGTEFITEHELEQRLPE
jgi:hypothetical protein